MNNMSILVCLLALFFVSGCPGGGGGSSDDDPPKPLMGLLQFRIRHNLQDDSCLASNDCFYSIYDTVRVEVDPQTKVFTTWLSGNVQFQPWLKLESIPRILQSRQDWSSGRAN